MKRHPQIAIQSYKGFILDKVCDIIRTVFNTTKGDRKMAHKIDAAACVGCGCCKDSCPTEAIVAGDAYSIDAEKCVDCGACASTCPAGAISAS